MVVNFKKRKKKKSVTWEGRDIVDFVVAPRTLCRQQISKEMGQR